MNSSFLKDPRVPFVMLLLSYIYIGINFLGFNRSFEQVFITLGFCCLIDVICYYIFVERKFAIPFSAMISGCSIVILANYAHSIYFPLVPSFFAITSKYLITVNKQHVYNPSLFGIVIALLVSDGMISISPAYQWGSSLAIIVFVVTAALFLFALRIRKNVLILSFIVLYAMQLCFRAWLVRFHLPFETLFLGALTSPAFYLFAFYMITDPKTSPSSKQGQFLMAFSIVLIDLYLNTIQSFSTLFYAGFLYFTIVWIYKLFVSFNVNPLSLYIAKNFGYRFAKISVFYCFLSFIFFGFVKFDPSDANGLFFEKIDNFVESKKSNILEQVDPKLQHVSKWLLSIGDAVVVSDFNNDNLVDLFFTLPLKSASDRAQLYLNKGNLKFEKFDLPILDNFRNNPKKYGLISGALAFDYDNDGDKDLFLTVGFGKNIFLKSNLIESESLSFDNYSSKLELDAYSISTSANVLDFDRDGRLDLFVANSMSTLLTGYNSATQFNIFKLPKEEYPEDRRMLNVMHRSWYDAKNGGLNKLFINKTDSFQEQDSIAVGLTETRWSLDVGTADFNLDGWTDVYVANDFGPDRLYMNQKGKYFSNIIGSRVGEIGRDTYKGMNVSIGDFNNDFQPDIYVSNVHHKLQAEGSILWLNNSGGDEVVASDFEDHAFQKGVLNENRFGWGATAADFDLDGDLDIVQANGMVDNSYDQIGSDNLVNNEEKCPDYWYWNSQIALTRPNIHGYADKWADLRGRCIFPNEKNRVYLNNGGSFVDYSKQVGVVEEGNFRAVASADLDNDGDLDMIITDMFSDPLIYNNKTSDKNWIGFSLKGNGTTCATDAHDSIVKIKYNQNRNKKAELEQQSRNVLLSNGLSSQSDIRVVFGLGKFKSDLDGVNAGLTHVNLSINWCGVGEEELGSFEVQKYHFIEQS